MTTNTTAKVEPTLEELKVGDEIVLVKSGSFHSRTIWHKVVRITPKFVIIGTPAMGWETRIEKSTGLEVGENRRCSHYSSRWYHPKHSIVDQVQTENTSRQNARDLKLRVEKVLSDTNFNAVFPIEELQARLMKAVLGSDGEALVAKQPIRLEGAINTQTED